MRGTRSRVITARILDHLHDTDLLVVDVHLQAGLQQALDVANDMPRITVEPGHHMHAGDLALCVEVDLALQDALDLRDPTLCVGHPGVALVRLPLQIGCSRTRVWPTLALRRSNLLRTGMLPH
ncbi:MAG: hypothetical protein IPG61_04080 [bacterium]|nr:hypothetical protein [bacterium]